ncbi:MAG: glycosyl transferase [bacterium]
MKPVRPILSTPPAEATAPPRDPAPDRPALLGGGDWTTLLLPGGGGRSCWREYAITAWNGNPHRAATQGLRVDVHPAVEPETPPGAPERQRPVPGAVLRTGGDAVAWEQRIWIVPGEDAEIRRIVVRNEGNEPADFAVSSFAEIALAKEPEWISHPAFAKLFLQTEWAAEPEALIVTRRPRSAGDRHPVLAHALLDATPDGYETDRRALLGRRLAHVPAPPTAPGRVGNVLDPALALAVRCRLTPGQTRTFTFAWMIGETREAALATLARLRANSPAPEDAAEAERDRRARLSLSDVDAERGLAWAARLLAERECAPRTITAGQAAAAAPESSSLELRADRPFVLVRSENPSERLHAVFRHWSELGLPIDVVFLRGEIPSSLRGLGFRSVSPARLSPTAREGLESLAGLVVDDALPDAPDPTSPGGPRPRARTAGPAMSPASNGSVFAGTEALVRFNGWGGFSPDGEEYVIRLPRARDGSLPLPPLPWCNVIAHEDFGMLVTETGASCTWSGNSREYRLTPWSNDTVSDPIDDALWLRDEDTGVVWSPTPGPVPGGDGYEVRHGFGRTRFRSTASGLRTETTMFVHATERVRFTRVRVTNPGSTARRLSIGNAVRLVLGTGAIGTSRFVASEVAGARVLAHNPLDVSPRRTTFAAAIGADRCETSGDLATFLGDSPELPLAVVRGGAVPPRNGLGAGAGAVFRATLVVAPDETRTVTFLLGDADDAAAAQALADRFTDTGDVDAAEHEAVTGWRRRLARVRVRTPSEELNLLLNGWLAYQTLSCRLFGRTAFYQSGGAFGFRDQLQDASSLLLLDPAGLRRQILRHAAHQFVEGDVLHWWHPPDSRGIRTRFADDLLWLPRETARYVAATGDVALLDREVPFLRAPALAAGEAERFLRPEPAGVSASLYEHCCRAIDRSLTTGAHGLPLFGAGDWNDGMNRVGHDGRGESAWMAFFLDDVLRSFAPIARARGDATRADRWDAHRSILRDALEENAWDGDWYRRGYYDDGTPLGTCDADECRIDALVQAWAVLTDTVPPERAARAMESATRHLVSEEDGLIRLLTPPFEHTPHDPGYIKGYVPGVRENGGQYTHAALWVVAAAAKLGWRDRAARWLDLLSPVRHTETAEDVARYGAEPYVIAADVYGKEPHVGRAGWTWYTGSAGWMVRVALESILGLELAGGRELRVSPHIPDSWPGFEVEWTAPDESRWRIVVRNPEGCAEEVVAATLDGNPLPVEAGTCRAPFPTTPGHRALEITLGRGGSA